MLHRSQPKPFNQSSNTNAVKKQIPINSVTQTIHGQLKETNLVILATAQILIESNERFNKCRALFDSGSLATLITEACAVILKLLKSKRSMCLVGVGQSNFAGPQYNRIVDIKSSIGATLTSQAFVLIEVTVKYQTGVLKLVNGNSNIIKWLIPVLIDHQNEI